ncbi:hypothetical protein [Psychromarinibacter halotolerans]|uniref:PGM1 C-terminal domain-containing protein n=1 Tax=Psychromarinibacter halotolerans TaxID=1775175 RepID=A0ABV7GU68_9RHOB|nr:hypothetical protein [Psychromarinibacter halotolerans]MDF0594623.1 hypothetical protein [Psychromarinibacter halotolerans]
MTWDPKLAMMRTELSRDLGQVKAWCEHKHPGRPRYTLVAVAKFYEAMGVSLEVGVAETEHPFDEDSIIRTAVKGLGVLGYFTSTSGAKWTSPGTIVFAADLSAHESLAAVRYFREMGLSE